jgi:hypothetical protein
MGIRGSGINEQVSVVFKVLDDQLNPVPGVTANFNILTPPAGLVWDLSSQTNGSGEVATRVQSGPVVGVFSVQVSLRTAPSIRTVSPTIGVRGARPSNQGFIFYCDRITLGAYISATPPRLDTTTCRVRLNDRFNNPVGGTDVHFMTEGGSIPSVATTTPFDPDGASPDEGTATVTFSTLGYMPQDVDPFPAAPSQYPMPRLAEPSYAWGGLTRNPRDGLVTVTAYVRGEEYFSDDNGNGRWDPGEMFIDQGEPFVDNNDNGVRDGLEQYQDLNGNGVWDGPNGRQDADTTIYAETRILYAGLPYAYDSSNYAPFAAACPGGLARATQVRKTLVVRDLNMNRLPAKVNGTNSAVAFTPAPPTILNTTLYDGPLTREHFGFDLQKVLVDVRGGACTAGSDAGCVWNVLFGTWDQGTRISMDIGNARTDNPPTGCQDVLLNTGITVDGLLTTYQSSGGVP